MHYKNGREAKVGDMVIGTSYNVKRYITGTLLSITPGLDSCSALVGYLVTKGINHETGKFEDGMAYGVDTLVRIAGDQQHGNSGAMTATFFKFDYTDCHSLLHVEDAIKQILEQSPDKDNWGCFV